MVWGVMIVWYLFLAGASAGAFATIAIADLRAADLGRVKLVGKIVAVIAIAIGLIMLMIDAQAGLHNPGRFFLLFSNPASMMTLGVYFITVYLILAVISIAFDLMKKAVPHWLNILGVISAFSVAVYTGLLLGAASPYPLWNNAALPILFVVSGASAGLATVMCLMRALEPEKFASLKLAHAMGIVLPVLEAVILFSMLYVVNASGAAGALSVAGLTSGAYAGLFWGCLVVVGLVVPFCIEAAQLKSGSTNGAAGYAANAATLVGGFFLRYLVVMAAVMTLFI